MRSGRLSDMFDQAIEILSAHRALHEKTAQLLLQNETLEEDDIRRLRAQIVPLSTVEEGTERPTTDVNSQHAVGK